MKNLFIDRLYYYFLEQFRISLVAQMVKRLSTMRETRVQSLDWEDPLEKEMAIHSSTLATSCEELTHWKRL